MWHKPFLFTAIGALIALSATVTGILSSVLSPLIGAVTGGKGSYA